MGHKVFDFLADFTTSFDLDADSNGTNAAKQMRTVMLAKSSRTLLNLNMKKLSMYDRRFWMVRWLSLGQGSRLMMAIISDYNFVWNGNNCVPVGPEPIEAGVCADPDQTYPRRSGRWEHESRRR